MPMMSVGDARGFLEEFGIHMFLEITLVAIIDPFLSNTVLSMFLGISIVEGCQLAWRKWRHHA